MKPITEFYNLRKDGTLLVVTKTTNNCYIRQVETGNLYEEAIDIGYYDSVSKQYFASNYTYEETDIEIGEISEEENEFSEERDSQG